MEIKEENMENQNIQESIIAPSIIRVLTDEELHYVSGGAGTNADKFI